MAARTPEFGKWDDEDVPYSQVFDKARKNRADRKPNQDNNNNNPYDSLQVKSPKHDALPSPRHEEVDLKRSPLRPTSSPYHHHHHRETPNNRNAKQTLGSDRGYDHNSPLHPQPQPQPQHHQTRTTNVKGGGSTVGVSSVGVSSSPANNERKGCSSEAPGRSRLRQIIKGKETSNQRPVPKFGDWDENDPAAAEGLTEAFEKVGKERQNPAGRVPTTTTHHHSHSNPHHQKSKKCCCFPWGGM